MLNLHDYVKTNIDAHFVRFEQPENRVCQKNFSLHLNKLKAREGKRG